MNAMRASLAFAVAAALIASAAAAADPAADEAKDEADDGVPARLDRAIPELRFHANAFCDVIDFLRDTTGVNVFVQYDQLAKVGIARDSAVTYTADHVKFSKALTDVLDAAAGHKGKATYGVVGRVVVLSTPADLKRMQAALAKHRAAKEPAAVTKSLPEVRFNANALSDVTDFLCDVSGVKIRPDWAALKAAGVERDAPVTARLRDVPVGDALLLILESIADAKVPLDYRVEHDGTVTISTAAKLAEPAPGAVRPK